MADGFLSRWSQRKQDVREGKPLAEPAPPAPAPEPAPAPGLTSVPAPVATAPPAADAEQPALPTLADAQQLTPASDFKPFMVKGVAADVKNAAMKKLFADPHFNIMDRLDTYIDDYSLADPIPEAMLRQMVSAKFLNLFDEDKELDGKSASNLPTALHDAVRVDPHTAAPETVAQSGVPLEAPTINDDDTDLRLQPDHALEPKGAGRSAA